MDKSRLPVDNCGCTVHKVATRALEDVTGGLSLWISPRKPVISGIWPVDKSAGASVRSPIASQEHPNDVLFSRNSLNSQGNPELCTGRPSLCVACYIVSIDV